MLKRDIEWKYLKRTNISSGNTFAFAVYTNAV